MSDTIEIRVSAFPDCWETCGTCASDDLEVVEVRVAPGDTIRLYDTLLVLEALKTELEIAAPRQVGWSGYGWRKAARWGPTRSC